MVSLSSPPAQRTEGVTLGWAWGRLGFQKWRPPEGQWVTQAPRHGGETEHGGWRKDRSVRPLRRRPWKGISQAAREGAVLHASGQDGPGQKRRLRTPLQPRTVPEFSAGSDREDHRSEAGAASVVSDILHVSFLAKYIPFIAHPQTQSHPGLEGTGNPRDVAVDSGKDTS